MSVCETSYDVTDDEGPPELIDSETDDDDIVQMDEDDDDKDHDDSVEGMSDISNGMENLELGSDPTHHEVGMSQSGQNVTWGEVVSTGNDGRSTNGVKYVFTCAARVNVDKNDKMVRVILDSGSDAHISNSMNLFIEGSMRKCNIQFVGIEGEGSIGMGLRASLSGSICLVLDDKNVVIDNVAYCGNVSVGAADGESVLLISVGELVGNSNLGVFFPAGNQMIQVLEGTKVIHTIHKANPHVAITAKVLVTKKRKRGNSHIPQKVQIDDADVKEPERERETDKQLNEEGVAESWGGCSDVKSDDHTSIPAPTQNASHANKLTVKERELLLLKLHRRLHFGASKTGKVLTFLSNAYGENFKTVATVLDNCDTCDWATGHMLTHPKISATRAVRPGQILRFDVFTSPWRMHKRDGGWAKYFLLVVDDYSNMLWGFTMRGKDEFFAKLIHLIKRIQNRVGKRVLKMLRGGIVDERGEEVDELKFISDVASVGADGAGENTSKRMLAFYDRIGIEPLLSLAHSQYQNGKAERLGGFVWKGGAAIRYAGNLPKSEQFRCMMAFMHQKNRLPSYSHPDLVTPYEMWENIKIPPMNLIKHFRAIGSLCKVAKMVLVGKEKRTYRAVLLGYAQDSDWQTVAKGYVVRDLASGEVKRITHAQLYKCNEDVMVYGDYRKNGDYDAWLKKHLRDIKQAGNEMAQKHRGMSCWDELEMEKSNREEKREKKNKKETKERKEECDETTKWMDLSSDESTDDQVKGPLPLPSEEPLDMKHQWEWLGGNEDMGETNAREREGEIERERERYAEEMKEEQKWEIRNLMLSVVSHAGDIDFMPVHVRYRQGDRVAVECEAVIVLEDARQAYAGPPHDVFVHVYDVSVHPMKHLLNYGRSINEINGWVDGAVWDGPDETTTYGRRHTFDEVNEVHPPVAKEGKMQYDEIWESDDETGWSADPAADGRFSQVSSSSKDDYGVTTRSALDDGPAWDKPKAWTDGLGFTLPALDEGGATEVKEQKAEHTEEATEAECYALELILAHKGTTQGNQYLCKWDLGERGSSYSFETTADLKHQQLEELDSYQKERKKKKKGNAFEVLKEFEESYGEVRAEYEHDHEMIKDIYKKRNMWYEPNKDDASECSEIDNENAEEEEKEVSVSAIMNQPVGRGIEDDSIDAI